MKTSTEEHHAETIDISAGGALFETEASIQVDSQVELTNRAALQPILPIHQHQPLELFAVVASRNGDPVYTNHRL